MKIRGVIHICQKGDWKRALRMLVDGLYSRGLLTVTDQIDLCVVSDTEMDTSYIIPKSTYHFMGPTELYERPSLLYLQSLAKQDTEEVYYWYLHTKGLRWFGNEKEQNVLDWIQLLLYWNCTVWQHAVDALNDGYETYGCNETSVVFPGFPPTSHYSGNFWWARSSYLRKLPDKIGSNYFHPEFWITSASPKLFCAFRSGIDHYYRSFPPHYYRA